jgi:hypothetical protein
MERSNRNLKLTFRLVQRRDDVFTVGAEEGLGRRGHSIALPLDRVGDHV